MKTYRVSCVDSELIPTTAIDAKKRVREMCERYPGKLVTLGIKDSRAFNPDRVVETFFRLRDGKIVDVTDEP